MTLTHMFYFIVSVTAQMQFSGKCEIRFLQSFLNRIPEPAKKGAKEARASSAISYNAFGGIIQLRTIKIKTNRFIILSFHLSP